MIKKKIIRCSFCGRQQSWTRKLILGAAVSICDECIDFCARIIDRDIRLDLIKARTAENCTSPGAIVNVLDQYVVGQQKAKKTLAVTVFNHYKRLEPIGIFDYYYDDYEEVELDKSNLLMLGQTGTGKTYLIETLTNTLKVPFIIADATTLTEAGYAGNDVETILQKLLLECDADVALAETGIVYIDEIDKICKKDKGFSLVRDVSGEGVQQALLKLIEGTTTTITLQGRKNEKKEPIKIDTSDILFICGGTFFEIERIVAQRVEKNTQTLFFGNAISQQKMQLSQESYDNIMKKVQPEDLVRFGLIPEFIGRIPVIVVLEELNKESLIDILCFPKNAIGKQYRRLFDLDDYTLIFTAFAVEKIVHLALKKKTGARSLRTILEHTLLNIMYEIPAISMIHAKNVIVSFSPLTNEATPFVLFEKNNITE